MTDNTQPDHIVDINEMVTDTNQERLKNQIITRVRENSRPTTEPTIDDLRLRIEEMYRSCLQDGGAIAMNRKSADGSPWKIRVTDFTDITMQLISDQVAKARIDERTQAQQYLHGLTITPENQHLFDVLSRNNHNRIATLNGVKK